MKVSVLGITLILSILLSLGSISGQQLPLDPLVRKGVLKNGLTYYIRHNKEPKQRADFYLAQKVGSVLEEENQRGLAHFLEHIAFNGSTHFPEKTMINYLESIGVKFGANLNAYTSTDETVYFMSDVPTIREGILDSTLLILADWSNGISMKETEINAERGVITEEWRTRNNASNRMFEALLPQIYPNSRYGTRLPIGNMEVIKNFKPQELRDYYDRWYRPDLQGIVVVGDINVDLVERKIKILFDTIPLPSPLLPRPLFEVPDNAESIVAIVKDKEASYSQVMLFLKLPSLTTAEKQDESFLTRSFAIQTIIQILNNRMQEESLKRDAPFIQMLADYGNYLTSNTKDAFSVAAATKEGKSIETANAIGKVLKQLQQHGITSAELERGKAHFLESVEVAYNNRNQTKNSDLSNDYIRSFIDNEPTPGIEFERNFYQQMVPKISIDALNKLISNVLQEIRQKNTILALMVQEKAEIKIPTNEELSTAFMQGWNSEVQAYTETISNKPLIPQLPKTGKIVSQKTDKQLGVTIWKLSNGMTIYLKNDIKEDNIISLNLVRTTGFNLFDKTDDANIQIATQLLNQSKVGAYTQTDLQKRLAGKMADINISINEYSTRLVGASSDKDIKTLFELYYAYFTSINGDEQVFESTMEMLNSLLPNQEKLPSYVFQDSLMQATFPNSSRMRPIHCEQLNQINYNRILQMYHTLVENAADYTGIIVGNFSTDSIRPLVCQYWATLPSKKRATKGQNTPLPLRAITHEQQFSIPMPTPKATVTYRIQIPGKQHFEWGFQLKALADLMNIIYVETIREQESGTYGVRVHYQYDPQGFNNFFSYNFDTNNESAEKLNQKALHELRKIANGETSIQTLNKVKENLLKTNEENQENRGYWNSLLEKLSLYNIDDRTNYKQMIERLTPESISKIAKEILTQPSVQLIMNGTKTAK